MKNLPVPNDLKNILKNLTKKQRDFVLNYDGEPLYKVAEKAGYKSPGYASWQLMQNPNVKEALRIISDIHMNAVGIQPSELVKFWCDVLQDDEEDMRYRLDASKLLAKFYGIARNEPLIDNSDNRAINIVINENKTSKEDTAEIERLKKALPDYEAAIKEDKDRNVIDVQFEKEINDILDELM